MKYNVETLPRMEADINKKTSRIENETVLGNWTFLGNTVNGPSIGDTINSNNNIDGGNASSIYLSNQKINGGGAQ